MIVMTKGGSARYRYKATRNPKVLMKGLQDALSDQYANKFIEFSLRMVEILPQCELHYFEDWAKEAVGDNVCAP